IGGRGRRGLLPGVVAQMTRHGARRHSSAPAQGHTSDISRVLATACGSHGPCVGQTRLPPVIFRGPGGLFTEDRGPPKSGSKRFGEPLAPAGFRPLYVRNVRREVAHCECCDTMSHVVSVLVKEVWLMPET